MTYMSSRNGRTNPQLKGMQGIVQSVTVNTYLKWYSPAYIKWQK